MVAMLPVGIAIGYRTAHAQNARPKHVHDWSKWRSVPAYMLLKRTGQTVDTTMQVRDCSTCGLQQTAD